MKILAVDDDAIILKLLEQIILALGDHDLTIAESGAEALDIIAASGDAPFDCFLFDIQMPKMDGIELVQHLRTFEAYVDAPVLMLTAMSDKRYIDRAFAVGATDYVTKPFEVTELETRLNLLQTVAQHRQAQSKQIHAAMNGTAGDGPTDDLEFEYYEPFSIYDVENVIDHTSFENYLAQLSRSSLFGSTIFAFALRRAAEFYDTMSSFEFYSLISDAAEVISDALHGHQFLMSYAGNGVFVCVTEAGWRPEMERLQDQVNLLFVRTELYNNAGQRLDIRVVTGEAVRLVWKSGNTIYDALATAHSSAEEKAIRKERERGSIWLTQSSA